MTLRNILASLSVLGLAATMTPAMADNGKSNGQGATHSNSSHSKSASKDSTEKDKSAKKADDSTEVETEDDPDKGDLASELKGLNAVKANPNALEHASPNSQVGRIAAYQDAALATVAVQQVLGAATEALAVLPVPARDVASIDADIAALDPAAVDYAQTLAALQAERGDAQAYEDAAAAVALAAQAQADAQAAEDAALLIASDGRILSDEAIAFMRDVLNI